MSTNAIIAARIPGEPDKGRRPYLAIYCHFDGYVSGVGQILHDHYQDPFARGALMALGDLSILDERPFPRDPLGHSFTNRESGTCVAYARDRGDKAPDTCAERWALADLLGEYTGQDWHVYYHDGDQWHVVLPGQKTSTPLTDALQS